MFPKNSSTIDRVLRVIVSVILLAWALFMGGPIWAWIGGVPLLTGTIGSCPAYKILGINTYKLK